MILYRRVPRTWGSRDACCYQRKHPMTDRECVYYSKSHSSFWRAGWWQPRWVAEWLRLNVGGLYRLKGNLTLQGLLGTEKTVPETESEGWVWSSFQYKKWWLWRYVHEMAAIARCWWGFHWMLGSLSSPGEHSHSLKQLCSVTIQAQPQPLTELKFDYEVSCLPDCPTLRYERVFFKISINSMKVTWMNHSCS